MKEHLNENTLSAMLGMLLPETEYLVLVVEGSDDRLLLSDHCSEDLRVLEGTGGRGQVLRTAELARKRGLQGVKFLVDRDYDHFCGIDYEGMENVLVSDNHDCFLDIVMNEPALLSKVVEVHSASAVRRPADAGYKKPVAAAESIIADALDLASKLAAVRIVSARNGLALTFTAFSFGSLQVRDFELQPIVDIVLTRSRYQEPDRAEIFEQVVEVHAEIRGLPVPPVGDHDLFAALARVLKLFGVAVSDSTLQRAFIVAGSLSCTSVMKTGWYKEIQRWSAGYGRAGLSCANVALAA